jgi:hypothetical protein
MDLKFWERKPIPKTVPPELDSLILAVQASSSQPQALRTAYRLLSQRYRGRRGQTYTHLAQLFRSSDSVLRSRPGFLHCTHMNYLLMVILVKSGWFEPEDITLHWTVVFGFSPHQYVTVRLGADWTAVDIWGASYGIGLGDYSHWFHVGRLW